MGDTYSYSRISTYENCPFKFKLHYVDKNYAYSDSLATSFGTAIHVAEEAIANCIKDSKPIDYIAIKNKFIVDCQEVDHKFHQDFAAIDPKCGKNYYEKMYDYLEKNIYRQEAFMKEHPTYEIIGAELSYYVEICGEQFVAKIDRLLHDTATDMYIIQDIKSWAEMKDKDLVTPLQFVVYSLAVQKEFNCTEDRIKCQYDLPVLASYYDAGTKGFMKRGVNKLQQLFNGIYSEDFHPTPSPLCNYCSYSMTSPEAPKEHKHKCPYFCHWTRQIRNNFDIKVLENTWQGIDKHQEIYEAFKKKYNI